MKDGSFLKGNLFFKDFINENGVQNSNSDQEKIDDKMEDDEREGDDAYTKMKHQLQRYYT